MQPYVPHVPCGCESDAVPFPAHTFLTSPTDIMAQAKKLCLEKVTDAFETVIKSVFNRKSKTRVLTKDSYRTAHIPWWNWNSIT